jgi:hypothetical protein
MADLQNAVPAREPRWPLRSTDELLAFAITPPAVECASIDGQLIALTPWFEPEVNPVHAGIYEVENCYLDSMPLYRMWDGARWLMGSASVDGAASMARLDATATSRPLSWRGLSSQAGTTTTSKETA